MTRILIVDDILENRYLLEVLLKGYGHEVSSEANGAEALKSARQFPPDLVIADILMPVMDGYAFCRSWKTDPELRHIPFIFYTATYTEPEDEEFALSLGAERFVIKPQEPEALGTIVREVLEQHQAGTLKGAAQSLKQESEYLEGHNRALFRKLEKKMTDLEQMNHEMSLEKAERRRLEEALIRCGEKIRNLLDASPLAIIWMDMQGTVLFANRTFVDLFGYRTEDMPRITALFNRACPDAGQRAAMVALWDETVEEADADNWATAPVEVLIACKDGTLRQVSVVNAVITDIRLAIFSDLTVNKQLESQLMHAQKMEVVGRMAGGVAHDLNNILTAIAGYGHLLMAKLPSEEPSRKYVEQILRASDRASNLTGSICAFSRKRKMITAKPVRLNEIVRDASSLLRRLIPEGVELKTVLLADDVTINADPGQIEQVLMNLVTNAGDAVSGKGAITIGTVLVTGDGNCTNAGGLEANVTYALLTVDDTGQGMDETTRERIFEPFFTTKDMGKGTGLGLSVVHEIVKLHHGIIKVWSEPHKGTRFSIYLPVV
jgi:two-component system, cell cycle sensor histidine kinase and response regulator CckA